MGELSRAPLQFAASEDKSSSELAGAVPTVINAVMDQAGVARRRPGIKAWAPFPAASASGSPVIGMCPFGQQLVYVTEDRKLHAVSSVGGVTELSSTDVLTTLDGGKRPVMVAGRRMLVVAGGGAVQKWTGTGLSARLQNDPPNADFICAIAQRLLLSSPGGSGDMAWSGPLEDYEDWDFATTGHAGYTQASAKPDPIKAMLDNTNEVFCFGSETTQVMAPSAMTIDETDPNNVSWFAPNRTINVGTVAPYSVVPYDDMFMMLDRLRRVIMTDARSYKDVSKPMATILRAMASIEDCWAFRMKFGRFDAVVFVFPTDGYGLFYDAALGNWGEWRAWDGGYVPIQITSTYNWSEQGVYLVGLSDGSIAQLDENTNTDMGDPIKVRLVSGFTNNGTMAKKDCRSLTLMFKRTWEALPAPAGGSLSASGHVRVWNRDDLGTWQHVADIELSSDPSPFEILRSLGVYRSRQWAVEYDGADEIQLVGAEEEFEALGA